MYISGEKMGNNQKDCRLINTRHQLAVLEIKLSTGSFRIPDEWVQLSQDIV